MMKEKKNVCVNLTKPYLDAMKSLVQRGVYVNRPDLIKDALRQLFRHYELLLFVEKEWAEESAAESAVKH